MANQIDDSELIKKIREGDEAAFRKLINRHRDRLVNFCIRFLGNREEGEDVAQEVCVLLYEKLNSFRGDSQFSTWLYRIAVNRCKNRHGNWWSRLLRNGKRVSSVDRETSEIAIVDGMENPEGAAHQGEMSKILMGEITELPCQFREVILLRDLQDHSYDEIAEITKSSVGTVKSRLSRGRKMLQEKLKGVRDEF